MGRTDTGLSNNSPNDSEVSPNRELDHPVSDDDSDSDFDQAEEERLGDYMPLSQYPNDGESSNDLNNESDNDEYTSSDTDTGEAAAIGNIPVPNRTDIGTVLVEEVWSAPPPKEVDIELTEKKIDLVKQVMLNIQLPSDAIPEWAKNIPEADWKDHLIKRINKSDN